jgi:hypothetical protein
MRMSLTTVELYRQSVEIASHPVSTASRGCRDSRYMAGAWGKEDMNDRYLVQ